MAPIRSMVGRAVAVRRQPTTPGPAHRRAVPPASRPPTMDASPTAGSRRCTGGTTLPVPVIAAVHGHALGGGAQLALGADIRVIAPDAQLSILEIRWGLIPDMTGTQALVDLVGLDVAKELTFTGRMVTGTEAGSLGLATHVVDDPRSHALELAAEIASKSPDAIRAAKRLFNDAPKQSRADGFAGERLEISRLIGSPNQVEQVTAFFERRAPEFTDPS